MCLAESNFENLFRPGPNPCPIHPRFDRGNYTTSPMSGFGGYQRACQYCIVDAIKKLRDPEWVRLAAIDTPIDDKTIEVVLDVLDQKFGL